MSSDVVNSEKLIVIHQSASKNKININKKQKIITFVGKLNKSKGYDLFGKAILKILENIIIGRRLLLATNQEIKLILIIKDYLNWDLLNILKF